MTWAARLHAATLDRIEPVSRLGVIRWDASQPIAENESGNLIASGVSAYDAVTAMFFGLLAQGESARAEELLAAWRTDEPDEPQIRFLSGVFAWWLGDERQAEEDFTATLAAQPGHVMTQLAVAELCEHVPVMRAPRERRYASSSLTAAAPSIPLARLSPRASTCSPISHPAMIRPSTQRFNSGFRANVSPMKVP